MTQKAYLGIGTILAAALIFAAQAHANQQICSTRAKLITALAEKYKETRQSYGVDGASNRIEVFANPKTGSWSLLITRPDGVSCIVSSGIGFETGIAA